MANFPTSKDDASSLPNPPGTAYLNNPDHGSLHTAENAAIIALETKVGTGSSIPASNTILIGTGTGTSAWTQMTSSQLAASLTDETGTGSVVFATSPTLVTPKVDTINESTLNNGTTIGGINLKAGALNTSSSVPTAALQDSAVTTVKLASSSVTGSKIASYGYNTQADTTNTVQTALIIKEGWGYVNPSSGSAITKAITFPVAFLTSVVQVQIGVIGARTSGVPTAITDFNVGISGEIVMASISTAVTTTGFTIQLYKNTNFSSASTYYGFWWRAVGT